MSFFSEEDDAQWVNDSRLSCEFCEVHTRMPGHAICVYCDRVKVPNAAAQIANEAAEFLTKYVDWSVYQATHPYEERKEA